MILHRVGFIKNRNIHDSVAAANEVIFRSKITREEGFLLKLDFEKAYDSVSWECVMEALEPKVLDRDGLNGSVLVFALGNHGYCLAEN